MTSSLKLARSVFPMIGRFGCLIAVGLLVSPLHAADNEPPKLVVVISVDQLCQDYLVRFRDNFAADGIVRRIAEHGAEYAQCHHRHALTVTAPGHAVQLTGAYPNSHGVIGNNWFDRDSGKDRYCVIDAAEQVVGLPSGKAASPRVLLVETVGDLMKLSSSGRSKVIGVAIKDRAAVLMTGHKADAAYWMDNNKWVTSTYYRADLPGYLRIMNDGNALDRYRGQKWELSLSPERYHNNCPDKNTWENPPKGMTSEFPHAVTAADEKTTADVFGDQVLYSPFGNEWTLDTAREIILGEQLGKDHFTDLLAINLSSNDYVGHAFGPNSLEVEDMTYQTDRQLGAFSRFLDETIGEGKWTLAITADHGVAPIVEYAAQFNLPAQRNVLGSLTKVQTTLEAEIRSQLGITGDTSPIVAKVDDSQVFLQHGHPELAGERFSLAQNVVREWLLDQPFVHDAKIRSELLSPSSDRISTAMHLAFHPHRSGDVMFVYSPYVVPGTRGTTHGSPWHYDTHVPMMLLGNGIKNATSRRRVSPACLASTVAELVGVDYPSANVEEPLREALQP